MQYQSPYKFLYLLLLILFYKFYILKLVNIIPQYSRKKKILPTKRNFARDIPLPQQNFKNN